MLLHDLVSLSDVVAVDISVLWRWDRIQCSVSDLVLRSQSATNLSHDAIME